jgi:hypothetical protein
MSDKKLLKFAVEMKEDPVKVEKSQFTKLHLRIYSADKINDHNFIMSMDVLKKYADTIAGKPILAYYNKNGDYGKGDFGGHEHSPLAQEIAVGFIPFNPEISYETENATTYLCVDGYIWNTYYEHIVDVFYKDGGIKGVSVEMYVLDSKLQKNNVEEILQYSFTGVTLIGKTDAYNTKIKPAVDGCQAKIIQFAAITLDDVMQPEFNKAKQLFEKQLVKNAIEEPESNGSILLQKNKSEKEEEMAETSKDLEKEIKDTEEKEIIENSTEVVESNIVIENSTEEVPETVENAESDGQAVEENSNEVVENSDDVDKNSDPDIQENDTEETESSCDYDELSQKCAEFATALKEKESENEALRIENASLREFKHNKEMEDVTKTVNLVLNSVSSTLSAKQLTEWKEKGLQCNASTVDGYVNSLKAFAYDIQQEKGVQEKELLRNSIPTQAVETEPESEDIWERMKNY